MIYNGRAFCYETRPDYSQVLLEKNLVARGGLRGLINDSQWPCILLRNSSRLLSGAPGKNLVAKGGLRGLINDLQLPCKMLRNSSRLLLGAPGKNLVVKGGLIGLINDL